MSYDIVKYERGQVWVIRHKYKNDAVGHEQIKDRPWLILSVGKFNKSSGMLTAVPITTRDQVRTVAHVQFYNDLGRSNIILCEQIKTFDYSSGAYTFDYMGRVSDEIMEKVDVALSIHLGMHYSPITLKSLYDTMESIIKSVGHLQDRERDAKFSDADVHDFINRVKSLAGVTTLTDSEVAAARQINPLDEFRGLHAVEDLAEEIKRSHEKTTRMKWTKEKCEEFLSDTDTMSVKETMEKWSIEKTTRYYSMKNYVKSVLEKFNTEDLEKSPSV